MTDKPKELVGIAVYCNVCRLRKKPHGRSAPLVMANSLCDDECPGYSDVPLPGCLWPGESKSEFGFKVCSHATELRELEEPRR